MSPTANHGKETSDAGKQPSPAAEPTIDLTLNRFTQKIGASAFIPVPQTEGDRVLDALDCEVRDLNRRVSRCLESLKKGLQQPLSGGMTAAIRSDCIQLYRCGQEANASQSAIDQICESKIAPELVSWVREVAEKRDWLPNAADGWPSFAAYRAVSVQMAENLICALDPYLRKLTVETFRALKSEKALEAGDPRIFELGLLLEARNNLDSQGLDQRSWDRLREIFPGILGDCEDLACAAAPPFKVDLDRIEAFRLEAGDTSSAAREPLASAAEWVAKQLAAALKEPGRLHAAIDYFHELAQATHEFTQINVEARKDLPVFEIDALQLKNPQRTIYELRFSATPFACAQAFNLMLSEVMIRGADNRLRRLDPASPEERALLLGVAQAYLEEYIHALQSVKGALNFNGDHVCEAPAAFISSSLCREYCIDRQIRMDRPLGGKNEVQKFHEIDVLGKMVELFLETGIPLERLALECFEFHFDYRADFVDWLSTKGILPGPMIPPWFLDQNLREEKIAAEGGDERSSSGRNAATRKKLR